MRWFILLIPFALLYPLEPRRTPYYGEQVLPHGSPMPPVLKKERHRPVDR